MSGARIILAGESGGNACLAHATARLENAGDHGCYLPFMADITVLHNKH